MGFHVGDVVRIRDWDDMVAEFGTVRNGTAIGCPHFLFIDEMKFLCGRILTISDIEYEYADVPRHPCYEFKFVQGVGYHITNFMVSKVEHQKAKIQEQIMSLFED